MGWMGKPGSVLLTGATGLLGRYLLRDLLTFGWSTAVLVRDSRDQTGEERIRELTAWWSDALRMPLPPPVVLCGDLGTAGLGLTAADRAWIASHCDTVLHAAGNVALRRSAGSDPWATNVDGTQHLLDLCTALRIGELHHISTAFICGTRSGPVLESERDEGQSFHNEYERSKLEAERRVAAAPLRATIYRPSVIVGDSRTGYTSSYHGVYRFLELAARLAGPATGARRLLRLRLPFTGEEPRNLVPVDWVARAILGIVNQPYCHGLTYHLVARNPVRVREIKDIAETVLGIDGVVWAEPDWSPPADSLEAAFLGQVREYWPYMHGDPVFGYRNTRTALPWLPAPHLDRAMLERLIRYAVSDRWGRPERQHRSGPDNGACAAYLEHFFPEAARRSSLARVPIRATIGLEVRGPGGGQWTCRWDEDGPRVRRGLPEQADVIYQLDRATFTDLVHGRERAPDAFLARRIEIAGDVEKGLKLAVLFDQFVKECPCPLSPAEEPDAAAVLV